MNLNLEWNGERGRRKEQKNHKTTKITAGIAGNSGLKSKEEVLFFENFARESESFLGNVRWLTTNEAAQYLRISNSSIKTMIYRGQVRVHKLGRRNRFLKDELERLITLAPTKPEV